MLPKQRKAVRVATCATFTGVRMTTPAQPVTILILPCEKNNAGHPPGVERFARFSREQQLPLRSYHHRVKDWSLSAADGELRILTGVAGRAARMGHRLTIAMNSWQATVQWSGERPTHAELSVTVDSLEVLSGEGGITPLSVPEKGVARANALKTLDAKKFPAIRFTADDIVKTDDGYRLAGTVEIHGTSRPQAVDVKIEDSGTAWTMSTRVSLHQSDFGVKPYSLFMGSLKVADEVTIDFRASRLTS